mgnify:CR=1 FL=1
MNIPKYNNGRNNFMGNINKPNSELSSEEIRDKRAVNCAKKLSIDYVNIVPENGDFAPRRFSFDIPDTQNESIYTLEVDKNNPKDQRIFSIGASRKGSDMLVSCVLCNGTKKEIIDFLKDDKNNELFKKVVQETSDAIDDKFI